MSAFKKFTDFCGGLAAFAAIFYLFREFMPFKPKEEPESLLAKVKLFFSDEPQFEYRPYLMLIILLLLLMAGDCQEDRNTALLTLVLYLFL